MQRSLDLFLCTWHLGPRTLVELEAIKAQVQADKPDEWAHSRMKEARWPVKHALF